MSQLRQHVSGRASLQCLSLHLSPVSFKPTIRFAKLPASCERTGPSTAAD